MGRPGSALDPLVRDEVEVALGGVVDALVHYGAGQHVPVPLVLVPILGEEPYGEVNMQLYFH